MSRPSPKWCTARLGDVVCQRRFGHDGPHRCEVREPQPAADGDALEAQVVTWQTP